MILNQSEAAKLLGVTERTIRDWQKLTPNLPFKKINQTVAEYDASEIVSWFTEYKLQQFKNTQVYTTEDKKLFETREAAARAELKEIELSVAKGDLLPVKDVEIQWTNLILTIRQSILTLPHVIATIIDDGLSYQEKKYKIQN